jgi:hypothetical protein
MKKVITLLGTVLLILIFLSCNNKKEKQQDKKEKQKNKKEKQQFELELPSYIKLLNNKTERTRLWEAAIDSGNFVAYNKIAFAYLMTYRFVDLYYYSLIMANKYQCPEAYLNMYLILTHTVSTSDLTLFSNDNNTKNLALYYLLKAKELGLTSAEFGINEEFGKGKTGTKFIIFSKEVNEPRCPHHAPA